MSLTTRENRWPSFQKQKLKIHRVLYGRPPSREVSTRNELPQGINTLTLINGKPPLASPLAMAAKQRRTNSVIMEVAGAGNTVMFAYIWGCIQSGLSEINLEHRNSDGHNLYAVSGCACEDAEAKGKGGKGGKKGSENREIKRMVREMVEYDQWAPGPR